MRSDISAHIHSAFIGVVAFINVVMIAVASHDGSWIAFGIAIIYGPAINAGLAMVSLFGYVALPRTESRSFGRHAILSIGVPMIAVAIDYLLIGQMNLHGC